MPAFLYEVGIQLDARILTFPSLVFLLITSHQKVALEIDFSGTIRGYTELTIAPVSQDLRTIHLHSRQCEIHAVTVASQTADYIHYDPLSNITLSKSDDVHLYPEMKRKLYSALSECDEGELSIQLPQQVMLRQQSIMNGILDSSLPEESRSFDIPSFVIRIEYSMRGSSDGIQFVIPTDVYPYRAPHVYTTPTGSDSARCWVPCIDNLWERCTWDFEFVVPRSLDGSSEHPDSDDGGDYPTVVVCSGEFSEQVAHPYNSTKSIFVFSQAAPTSVQHIAFAAGPFHVHELSPDNQHVGEPGDDPISSQPQMHAFCLPGLEQSLSCTMSFYRSAMTFFSTDFTAYPFGSHKVVFVDELPTKRFDSATLSLVSNELLHDSSSIEQVYETRHALSHALACQWIGINIIQKTWSDTWLINGLGLYITGLFIKRLFGNNEYRFRLKKDMDRVVQTDNGAQPPICRPTHPDPPDASVLPFINLKSPIVLHVLDRRLGKSGALHSLLRIIPKIFRSALEGDMTGNALSTQSFLRTCRKTSGFDPRAFAEQWIYGSGCPRFHFNIAFNKKKLVVEFTMKQECPAYVANQDDPVALALLKPVSFFDGTITVRIHEPDGTPYEHVLDIRSPFKRYEILFNTKYKRVRRNTKRYISRKAALAAAAAGDQDAAEDTTALGTEFGYGLWEDEAEREKWRVADWTEEDEARMDGSIYEWIRMDADFEWIAEIRHEQADYMWVSQLQRDRDVVAQLEAIHALGRQPTPVISSFLTRTALVPNYFFRVRVEAVFQLINCAGPEFEHIGLFHLLKLLTTFCYEPQQGQLREFGHRFIPKPNNFSDFAEYFVRKAIIASLGQYNHSGSRHVEDDAVTEYLLEQLKYNDNTVNPYSDGMYLATLISALGSSLLPQVMPEQSQLVHVDPSVRQSERASALLREAIVQVDRYRDMDQLVPSTRNIVSVAILEWNLMLMMGNLIPNDGTLFLRYSREGNYKDVRLAAFDGLLLMKWYSSKTIIRYIFAVIASDSSRAVRRHVAKSVCESIAVLLAIGEIKSSSKEPESILIEEDPNAPEKRRAKKSEAEIMIKTLRGTVGRSASLRECIMPIMLAPNADHYVRLCMIKFADLIFRPSEESLPKMKILIPMTPSTETIPTSPSPAMPQSSLLKPKISQRKTSLVGLGANVGGAIPKIKLASRNSDLRSPLSSTTPIFPDTFMPPPPVPEHVFEVILKNKTPQASLASTPQLLPPPRKKEKQVSKARTSGMSPVDLKSCRNVMKKLIANKHSFLFRQPVDPVRDAAPGYFEKIKNPMDLSTINAKLEAGMYTDRQAFEADFYLMIRNAELFNPQGTFANNEAKAIESVFTQQWAKISAMLEKAAVQKATRDAETMETTGSAAESAALALESEITDADRVNLEAVDALTALAEPVPSPVPPEPLPAPPAPAPTPIPRAAIKLKISGSGTPKAMERASPSVKSGSPAPSQIATNNNRKTNGTDQTNGSKIKLSKPSTKISPPSAPSPKPIPALPPRSQTPLKRDYKTAIDVDPDDFLSQEIDMIEATKQTPVKKQKQRTQDDAEAIAPLPAAVSSAKDKKGKDKGLKLMNGSSRPSTPGIQQIPPTSNGSNSVPKLKKVQETAAPPPPPGVKLKLKAKESKESTPTSQTPQRSTPIDKNKCIGILKVLKKAPLAILFAEPVDPIKLNCPTYYDEIKHPMDFQTLETNLLAGKYATMEQFAHDVFLIFKNCRQFNGPGSPVSAAGDAIEQVFKAEWAKAMRLSSAEKLMVNKIITNLMQDDVGLWFKQPVDPVALNIPHYFDIIPLKDARDLKTIKADIIANKYDTFEAIEADIQLMIRNAVKFNGTDSLVGAAAVKLGHKFSSALSRKRKELATSKSSTPTPSASLASIDNGPPAKKLKLG